MENGAKKEKSSGEGEKKCPFIPPVRLARCHMGPLSIRWPCTSSGISRDRHGPQRNKGNTSSLQNTPRKIGKEKTPYSLLKRFNSKFLAPTYSCPEATIGAERLNGSVRNGKRCFPFARGARNSGLKREVVRNKTNLMSEDPERASRDPF